MLKKCTGCGEEKELNTDNFPLEKKRGKYVFRARCVICEKKRYKEYDNSKRKLNSVNIEGKFRKCSECGFIKEINKENFSYENKKGYRANCIICERKRYREYDKSKRKPNKTLEYKFKKIISKAVNSCLKKFGGSKNGKSHSKYLLWKYNEFVKHIESLFEPWMNWNNYGAYDTKTWNDNDPSTWKWNIDHIIPIADLPHSSMDHPNFKKCWALENLRPYSAKQNVLDGASRIRHRK